MTIPDYQSLMLPLLKQAAHAETRVPEVAEKLADELGITAEEQRLADLMVEHNVGVRISRAIEFKRLDEDFFAEED